jgi:hypothetical protein
VKWPFFTDDSTASDALFLLPAGRPAGLPDCPAWNCPGLFFSCFGRSACPALAYASSAMLSACNQVWRLPCDGQIEAWCGLQNEGTHDTARIQYRCSGTRDNRANSIRAAVGTLCAGYDVPGRVPL